MSTITILQACDLGNHYSWGWDKKEDAKVKRWYTARAREVASKYGATVQKVELEIVQYTGVFTTTLSVAKLIRTLSAAKLRSKKALLRKAFDSKNFGAGKPIQLDSLFSVEIINQKLNEEARTATFKCKVSTRMPATAASAAAAVPKVARLLKKNLVQRFTWDKNFKVQSVKLTQDKEYICVVLKELVSNAMKDDEIHFEGYMDFDDDGNYPIKVEVQPKFS